MRERKTDNPIDAVGFRFMSFMFKFRDLVKPPKKFLIETGMKNGDKILDYGCGPGSFVFPAAKIVGKEGKVYAADIHPLAIEIINKKARKKEIKNIETIQTNCATGLPSKSIDIILLYDVIHMFKEPKEIFTEMHRVLKPKGILSVCNPHIKEKNIVTLVEENSDFKLTTKGNKTLSFKKKLILC